MEKTESALKETLIVEESAAQTKRVPDSWYKLLLFLGVFNLFYFGVTITQAVFMDPSNFPFFFPWLFVLRGLFYILFFVYFVKIYRAEKTGSNEYYLGFLSIFAGIVFVLPLLQYIITLLIGLSVSGEESSNMAIQMQSLTRTFHMMLFGISIIMSSHVLKKNGLKFLAAAVLFLYILVSVIYNEITFRVGLNAQTTISLLMIYDNVVISIGYILNALVLKRS